MSRSRVLSKEEQALWREVTRHDSKFHADSSEEEIADEDEQTQGESVAQESHSPETRLRKQSTSFKLSTVNIDVPLGTDANTARRLKRGELPIERALDLHGLTRDEAYMLLTKKIPEWARVGVKVCAVITGKGRGGEGVLKRELPHWLNDVRLRYAIIAAVTAPRKYGGAGAVLLLLRRV